MHRRRLVRVPASSANLGPGFDVFAAALALHVELEVSRPAASPSRRGSTSRATVATSACAASRGCTRPTTSRFASARRYRCRAGWGPAPRPTSPGSSRPRTCSSSIADLLAHATELEGHPDNAAAALLGGFVIVSGGDVVRFDPPDGLEAVIVVPRTAVRTAVARRALPDKVPMADASANVARGAMLTLGLARRRSRRSSVRG